MTPATLGLETQCQLDFSAALRLNPFKAAAAVSPCCAAASAAAAACTAAAATGHSLNSIVPVHSPAAAAAASSQTVLNPFQGGSCCFTMLLCCCMLLCCSQLAGSSKSDSSRSLQQKLFHHAAAICSMLHATAHYSLSIFTAQSCSKLFSLVAMLHHSHNRAVFLFSIGQLFIFNYLLKLLVLLKKLKVLIFRPNFH